MALLALAKRTAPTVNLMVKPLTLQLLPQNNNSLQKYYKKNFEYVHKVMKQEGEARMLCQRVSNKSREILFDKLDSFL